MIRTPTCCIYGTGNGTPWNQANRDPKGGDNLYIASIVALKPDTGEYVWHYQTTPGDTWDYDAVSPMVTADLTIDGEKKHVVIQPNKNGFLYVLNAADGKLLSADAFTEVNWATGVDMKTGRPKVVAAAKYDKEPLESRARRAGRPQLASQCLQPRHRPAVHPDLGSLLPDDQVMPNYSAVDAAVRSTWASTFSVHRSTAANLKPTSKTGITGRLEGLGSGGAQGGVGNRGLRHGQPCGRPAVACWPPPATWCSRAMAPGKELRAYDAKSGEQLWSFPIADR